MSRLFPIRGTVDRDAEGTRLVDIDDDAAEAVFAALGSATARAILTAIYEEPRTASDVAEAVDTSLQNARYHIEKLRDAGLIEVADTWYSERGTEMKVYAPASESVVVFAGEERNTLRSVLESVLGTVGVLAIASLAVERLVRRPGFFGRVAPAGDGADDGGAPTTEMPAGTSEPSALTTRAAEHTSDATFTDATGGTANETLDLTARTTTEAVDATARTTAETVAGAGDPGSLVATPASPGLLFFLGGLLALALVLAWVAYR